MTTPEPGAALAVEARMNAARTPRRNYIIYVIYNANVQRMDGMVS